MGKNKPLNIFNKQLFEKSLGNVVDFSDGLLLPLVRPVPS